MTYNPRAIGLLPRYDGGKQFRQKQNEPNQLKILNKHRGLTKSGNVKRVRNNIWDYTLYTERGGTATLCDRYEKLYAWP